MALGGNTKFCVRKKRASSYLILRNIIEKLDSIIRWRLGIYLGSINI